jgi:hypothetical protein
MFSSAKVRLIIIVLAHPPLPTLSPSWVVLAYAGCRLRVPRWSRPEIP